MYCERWSNEAATVHADSTANAIACEGSPFPTDRYKDPILSSV